MQRMIIPRNKILFILSSFLLFTLYGCTSTLTKEKPATGCQILWKPNSENLRFKGSSASSIIMALAPDDSPSLKRNVFKGPNDIAQIKLTLFDRNITAARITFDIFLEDGFEFSRGGHKLPLGLWGGSLDSRCLAGGCPPTRQDGFSIRLIENQGLLGLYIYNLNRSSGSDKKVYGSTHISSTYIESNRWHKIAIDVFLNSPNRNDGMSYLWLNDKLVLIVRDLIFRNADDWFIRGPLLTELWGGDIYLWGSQSPKDQSIWFKNYRINKLNCHEDL